MISFWKVLIIVCVKFLFRSLQTSLLCIEGSKEGEGLWLWLWLFGFVTGGMWKVTQDKWHVTNETWQKTDCFFVLFSLFFFKIIFNGWFYKSKEAGVYQPDLWIHQALALFKEILEILALLILLLLQWRKCNSYRRNEFLNSKMLAIWRTILTFFNTMQMLVASWFQQTLGQNKAVCNSSQQHKGNKTLLLFC